MKSLIFYRIPSIPVTQTTRKVLVKKLKAAADKEKQKTRRETIAVTKFSSDEGGDSETDKKKREKTPNRRATVALVEKVTKAATSTSNGVKDDMPAPRSTRRASSGRTTPQAAEKPVAVTSSVPQIPQIQEDTDEEVKETLRSAPKRFSKSKSKTPTLSKTETVRISYQTVQDKIPESDDDIIFVDDEDEPETPAPKTPRKPEPEMKLISSKSETVVNRRKTFTTSGIPTLGTSNTHFTSSIPSTSTRYSSVADSKYERPALTTSFDYYNKTSKPVVQLEDYEDDIEENAPYLSNFAKRLSTLRAEPLDAGMDKYKKLSEKVEYPSYRAPTTSGYSYKRDVIPAKNKPSLMDSFVQILVALDRQYNIRKILYFAFVIFLLVAIYVIFFKN